MWAWVVTELVSPGLHQELPIQGRDRTRSPVPTSLRPALPEGARAGANSAGPSDLNVAFSGGKAGHRHQHRPWLSSGHKRRHGSVSAQVQTSPPSSLQFLLSPWLTELPCFSFFPFLHQTFVRHRGTQQWWWGGSLALPFSRPQLQPPDRQASHTIIFQIK